MSNHDIYSPPKVDVEPPSSSNAYDYAGFWVRMAAFVIDAILTMFIVIPLLASVNGFGFFFDESQILETRELFLIYTPSLVATTLFWTYRAATPGKMMLNLKVVNAASGENPDLKQSFIRHLGYLGSASVVGLGFLWIAWDPKRQGWHDKVANTVVIRPNPSNFKHAVFTPKVR